jgi:hypothetical protein
MIREPWNLSRREGSSRRQRNSHRPLSGLLFRTRMFFHSLDWSIRFSCSRARNNPPSVFGVEAESVNHYTEVAYVPLRYKKDSCRGRDSVNAPRQQLRTAQKSELRGTKRGQTIKTQFARYPSLSADVRSWFSPLNLTNRLLTSLTMPTKPAHSDIMRRKPTDHRSIGWFLAIELFSYFAVLASLLYNKTGTP